jgi:hypothetical protein
MTTLEGNFQFPNGAPVANGTVTLLLSWDSSESITSPDGVVVASELMSFALDENGSIVPASIWGNTELSGSTYYIVNVYDQNGVPVLKAPLTWTLS